MGAPSYTLTKYQGGAGAVFLYGVENIYLLHPKSDNATFSLKPGNPLVEAKIVSGNYVIYTGGQDSGTPAAPNNPPIPLVGTITISDPFGSTATVDAGDSSIYTFKKHVIPFSQALIDYLNLPGWLQAAAVKLTYTSNFSGIGQVCQIGNYSCSTQVGTLPTAYQDRVDHFWYALDWKGPFFIPSGSYIDMTVSGNIIVPYPVTSWSVPTLPSGDIVNSFISVDISNTAVH